eukprot:TRINITY_DN57132_c0_g1_i1.p1 TRINITY_DN57132_c0_g1~~TRINITY_DN57132_c0_g1_i1.p1  ORF type:complete len:1102 (-),score=198.09 TRINITY_DN57132_c0_g1_i1:2-3307(-)
MSPSDYKPSGGGSARILGMRESNQALAELKTKLEFALSRLNDQDTQRTGVEEIREFLQTLYPDWFPMVISCIGEAGANLKPLGRCESVKLLGLLAELHGDAIVPLLQRILQVVVTRLQDADLHLREACAETVFRLTRSLVVDVDGSHIFGTLLKPLFGALTEHNKWVQIGSASCICAVIQGSPPAVLSENLVRLCSRLVQHLSLPLAMARPQLLSACIHVMQAIDGTELDEVLPSLMPCLESCLNSTSDWQTRKQAVEVLQTIGDDVDLGQSLQISLPTDRSARPTPLQRRLALYLESLRDDKVRAVREAVKDVFLRWSVTTKQAVPSSPAVAAASIGASEKPERVPVRSGSPAPPGVLVAGPVAGRSMSPGPAWQQRDQSRVGDGAAASSGSRPTRNVRSVTRERETSAAPANTEDEPAADGQGDAAAEKAARDAAVQKALSHADLNSTKKPKPKRERVSIFNQPANSGFFQSANQQPFGGGPDDIEDVVVTTPLASEDRATPSNTMNGDAASHDPGVRRGGPDCPEPPALRKEEQTSHRSQTSRRDPDKSDRPEERDDTGLSGGGAEASSSEAAGFETGAGSAGEVPEDPPVEPWAVAHVSGRDASSRSRSARQPVRGSAGKPTTKPFQKQGKPPVQGEHWQDSTADFGERAESLSPRHARSISSPNKSEEATGVKPSRRGKLQQESSRVPEESEPSLAPGAWVWEEPAGRASVVTEPSASPSSCASAPSRRRSFDRPRREDDESLVAQIESLSERLLRLEEAKQVSEQQMAERLQQVIATCKGQGDLIAAQKRRLEEQEHRLHEQGERMNQLEEELASMDQLLQEQQLQIQQQDQRLDQDDQQLQEQQQQLEQQDQEIERHRILLKDVLVSNAASSDSSSVRQPRTQSSHGAHDRISSIPSSKRLPPDVLSLDSLVAGAVGSGGALAGSSSERPNAGVFRDVTGPGSLLQASEEAATKPLTKPSSQLWESAVELCADRRFLEAYKQVIAEPEETCLLRLMQHTGPIVDKLDAESNSRLIRRLIHILSSPSKEPTSASIEQIFSWLWQALNQGIHFTASQVEDLVSALHRVSGAQSSLSPPQKSEAAQILQQVSALRRS